MALEPESETLDETLGMRVNAKELEIFKKKSQRVTGKPYQLFLREIITAFNDGRLRIVQTEDQKNTGELYVND